MKVRFLAQNCKDTDINAYPPQFKLLLQCLLAYAIISNTSSPEVKADVSVPSSISANTTWTPTGNPYIIQYHDVTIEAGVTLTIEPGVVVKFGQSDSLYVNGDVVANGTAETEIVFTSMNDDSDGQDTNGDGISSTPAANDWGGLSFANTCTGSLLNHVVVRYGGREWSFPLWASAPALYVATSNLTVSNSTITENGTMGVRVDQCNPIIQNNTISNNGGDGIYLYNASPTISGNVIASNAGNGIAAHGSSNPQILGNSIEGNSWWAIGVDPLASGSTIQGNELLGPRAGIFVAAGELTADTLWSSDSVYVVEFGGQDVGGLTVAEGAMLAVGPSVVVKFTTSARLLVRGDLVAAGASERNIVFTSLKDDSYGGDTNGDGNLTLPMRNDWGNIVLWDTCTGSVLDHTIIKYAGRTWSSPNWVSLPAIEVLASNLVITYSTITENGQDGISVRLGSPVIGANIISNNERYGIELRAASPVVTDNTITGNAAGISHALDSGGNVYLNDFLNNTNHVCGQSSNIVWWSPDPLHYRYGGVDRTNYLGNHWDDYDGTDGNGDGVGDTPYVFQSGQDKYPLVAPALSYRNGGGGSNEPTLAEQAAELAKSVIGKLYHIERGNFCTKGWSNCDTWKVGEFSESSEIQYLDCSGLVYWSYNKAGKATSYYSFEVTDSTVKSLNPIAFEGANNQYYYNIDLIDRADLLPGDLLFFDAEEWKNSAFIGYGQDGRVDHVAMYVGRFTHDGVDCNVVEATPPKIIATTVDRIITRIQNLSGQSSFKGFGRVTPMPEISRNEAKGMGIILKCPATLVLTDPQGSVVTEDVREVPDMIYLQFDIDGDNELDEMVDVLTRETGDYLINIVPKPGSLPTDTYSIEIVTPGGPVMFAEDVRISDIPPDPYVVRVTEAGIALILPASIDFDPDTLNLRAFLKFVTAYIEAPSGFDISHIDVATIKLNDAVPALASPTAIGDHDGDGTPDLMVKFDARAVCPLLSLGLQTIRVSGRLADGRLFAGTDTIRIINTDGTTATTKQTDFVALQGQTAAIAVKEEAQSVIEPNGTNNQEAFDTKEAIAFMLCDASDSINTLSPADFSSEESAVELANIMDGVFAMLNDGMYLESLDVLENDVLQRMDGYANTGKSDKDDWITSVEGQALLYPQVAQAIDLLESLIR
jgi:parallel beta-helix repeat protein